MEVPKIIILKNCLFPFFLLFCSIGTDVTKAKSPKYLKKNEIFWKKMYVQIRLLQNSSRCGKIIKDLIISKIPKLIS